MNKHTRAPWKKGNDCIIAEIDRHVPTLIAITGNYGMGIPAVIPDDEEAEANQRIMIAAPEMLEALVYVRNTLHQSICGCDDCSCGDGWQFLDAKAISMMDSAIAKAQGT
jgi:hypothetical protein